MIIPDIPVNKKIVDEDGNITDHWRTFFHLLSTQLQRKTSESGFIVPTRPQKTITDFLDSEHTIGGLLYDNDSKNLKGNIEGKYNPMYDLLEKTLAEISAIPSGQRDGHFYYASDEPDANKALKVGFGNQIKTVTLT